MADPYRNFKFEVEVQGFTLAGFSKVSGLTEKTEVIEYGEGGDNESPRKLPGRTTFGDITLEHGYSDNVDFILWRREIYSALNSNGLQGGDDFRRDITIFLKNKAGARVRRWDVYNAWPSEKNSPELNATGNEVAIESLVLCNEGIVESYVRV
jgi:phage tail-like protein